MIFTQSSFYMQEILQTSGCVSICLPLWKDVKSPQSGARQLSAPPSLTSPRTTLRATGPSHCCASHSSCLKKMIHGRINPIIDPQLPHEQAGFHKEQSTVDRVILLTQNAEDCFEAKETACAVLVDLIAAYDTMWHRGLTLKLLWMLPDRHMVHFIVELISNHSLVLKTSDGQ